MNDGPPIEDGERMDRINPRIKQAAMATYTTNEVGLLKGSAFQLPARSSRG